MGGAHKKVGRRNGGAGRRGWMQLLPGLEPSAMMSRL